MTKRALSKDELEYIANHLSDIETDTDPFDTDDDRDKDYETETESSESDDLEREQMENEDDVEESTDSDRDELPANQVNELDQNENIRDNTQNQDDVIIWSTLSNNFLPRFTIPAINTCEIENSTRRSTKPLEIFKKMFPPSLFIFIVECTNKRLTKLEQEKKKKVTKTDVGEIAIILGCSLVMSYNNKLPALRHYWSTKFSVGNPIIKSSISRNRFTLLLAKLYFNDPDKKQNTSKTYYVDELINCLKSTFQKCRSDSSRQSIDESMVKFKGRSGIKQYLPMKPIKRGIKIWVRSDSLTGYTYDMNVYAGKEDRQQDGTLGERVVHKLASTIKSKDVVLCFDRFFTSVRLMTEISFPAVGTAMVNRKNIPKFAKKLDKGDSEIVGNVHGTICAKWQDTKEVLLLSNCHVNNITTVLRRGKDGIRKNVSCPEAIEFYNRFMGGVDLADQMSGLYDMDRKSGKWWKKVFFRLVMVAAVNSWIIHNELHRQKIPFIDFVINLAEEMIEFGKSVSQVHVRRRSTGRPSKKAKTMLNVGDHLPVEGKTRRRCTRCSQRKIEKRTTTVCRMCQLPLCKNCFAAYHT